MVISPKKRLTAWLRLTTLQIYVILTYLFFFFGAEDAARITAKNGLEFYVHNRDLRNLLTDEKLADRFDAADNGEPGGAGGPGDFPATGGFPGGAPGGFYGPEEGPSVEEVNYIYISFEVGSFALHLRDYVSTIL